MSTFSHNFNIWHFVGAQGRNLVIRLMISLPCALTCIAENNNSMHVIGHDYIGRKIHLWKPPPQAQPLLLRNPSERTQLHRAVGDIPKQTFPPPGAQGDKIRSGLGVIIILQADRAALVFLGIEFHACAVGRFATDEAWLGISSILPAGDVVEKIPTWFL